MYKVDYVWGSRNSVKKKPGQIIYAFINIYMIKVQCIFFIYIINYIKPLEIITIRLIKVSNFVRV